MTKPIFIQSNASDAELTTKAKEIGVPLKTLKNMLDYAQHLRDRADELDISPPQQVSALVTVIGDVIKMNYPNATHADLITDVVDQLWAVCELSPHSQTTTTTTH